MVAPVVLISFNRPDQTRRTLENIRAAAPSELFAIVDGPRADHPDDARLCDEVKAELEHIDWPCTVHRRYAETNLGCAANIELGLDWVFSQVPHAIVLEDDCLADPTFFRFCTELLEKYAGDDRIGYIGGAAPELEAQHFAGYSYAFTAFASIWGWATWRREWQAHRALYPRTHAAGDTTSRRTQPIDWSGTNLISTSGQRFFRGAGPALDKKSSTWAIHWCVSVIARRSLAITASSLLVENIGFGPGGTHTQSSRETPPVRPMQFPLVHPPQVAINATVERAYERVAAQELGPLARLARSVIPAGPLRTIARRIHYRRTSTMPTRRSGAARREA